MDIEQILNLLKDPEALERLHRQAPASFRQALPDALARRPDDLLLRAWAARLEPAARPVTYTGVAPAIAIALGAALMVRLPALWLAEDWYYPRFAPQVVLMALCLYFWRGRQDRRLLWGGLALALLTGVHAGLLPGASDAVVMALIHLPLLWWALLGVAFTAPSWRDTTARMQFLRYNGELLVLGSLVALGGGVFSGLSVGLFELLRPGAGEWYAENIGVMGAAALPVAATWLYDAVFRRHTGIAPVLARIFAPLFLAMVVVYLAVAGVSGGNPFVDRDFLIAVNGLMVVVLGMAILTVAERGDEPAGSWADRTILALLGATLVLDLLALGAVLFRLGSFGPTPNRVVVLGANLVILVHLLALARAQRRHLRGALELAGLRQAAAGYLPVYVVWAALVVFLLPVLFS